MRIAAATIRSTPVTPNLKSLAPTSSVSASITRFPFRFRESAGILAPQPCFSRASRLGSLRSARDRRRQAGQDPRACEVAWRAQRRLNNRWEHLGGKRRKPAGVVAVAVARELSAFLWEAATLD